MSEEQKNNPLHGIKLENLLTELVDHYGFEILAAQININCFKSNPSVPSSLKFLRKTPWARNKVEAFYLYRYKNLPRPSDSQFELPPRERAVSLTEESVAPAKLDPEDKEFFDDPESGYIPRKGAFDKKPRPKPTGVSRRNKSSDTGPTPDPWGKWRNKNPASNDE